MCPICPVAGTVRLGYTVPMTPTKENVLDMYSRASFYAWSTGMGWYEVANDTAKSMDKRFHRSAGVIAALSPMNEWENNVAKARALYAIDGQVVPIKGQPNGFGLGDNVRKAVRIMRGEDALDVLGGPKVRSFYLTIVDPMADTDPVIDRHAFDIAIGMRTKPEVKSILSRKGVYDSFVRVYREAALDLNLTPRQVQAITWTAFKEIHGIK